MYTNLCSAMGRRNMIMGSQIPNLAGSPSSPTMCRYELSEPQWTRIAALLPHRTHHGQAGHPFNDPRPIVNGILWILQPAPVA